MAFVVTNNTLQLSPAHGIPPDVNFDVVTQIDDIASKLSIINLRGDSLFFK